MDPELQGDSEHYATVTPQRRRAVVFGSSDVLRTIGRPEFLERAGATEVVWEVPTRFDVLVQRLCAGPRVPPDLPAALGDWFCSMVSTEAAADDVSLVVMSLRHELLGAAPWRHRDTGLLLDPPPDHATEWDDDELEWLHSECEPAGLLGTASSIEAMHRVIDLLHGDGRTVLMMSVSTYDPTDTTFSYSGLEDTYSLRAHRLTAEVQGLALERGVGFVDVDKAIAELGAAEHVPAAGEFSDEAARFIAEEAIFSFDQAALFGASVQPDVMRLVVPTYDRRSALARGRLLRWHIGPRTQIRRGDDLFDVLFEDLPIRVDNDYPGRVKRPSARGRRPTRRKSLTTTVVAASDGFLCDVMTGEGVAVDVGDLVGVVTRVRTDDSPPPGEATGDFRVAMRRTAVTRQTDLGGVTR